MLDRQLGDQKRRVELAERALIAFYEARDVFTFVRSRGIFGGEGSSRQSSEAEGEAQKRKRDNYFVPIERLTREKELFARLQSLRYAFAANFGIATTEPFKAVWDAHNRIASSASVLIQLTFDGDDDRAGNEALFNAIGWGPAARPDEVDRMIEKAVTEIEAVCRPVRMCGAMLLPEQLQRHALPPELAMDRWPVRLWPPRLDLGQRRRRREQPHLQRLVAQVVR